MSLADGDEEERTTTTLPKAEYIQDVEAHLEGR